MSDDDNLYAGFVLLTIVFVVFVLGAIGGIVFANWQHEYVSDDTLVKFRIAENITSNMTIKEKTEHIKAACEDNVSREACYGEMYKIFIEPSIGR